MTEKERLDLYAGKIDYMDGSDFEYFCASLLEKNGYTRVTVTTASGDFGIDIIAYKGGRKYGIQCKRYNSPVGISSVQEALSGKEYYGCNYAVVLTNQYFTSAAKELASKTDIILWDRDDLLRMVGEKPQNEKIDISEDEAKNICYQLKRALYSCGVNMTITDMDLYRDDFVVSFAPEPGIRVAKVLSCEPDLCIHFSCKVKLRMNPSKGRIEFIISKENIKNYFLKKKNAMKEKAQNWLKEQAIACDESGLLYNQFSQLVWKMALQEIDRMSADEDNIFIEYIKNMVPPVDVTIVRTDVLSRQYQLTALVNWNDRFIHSDLYQDYLGKMDKLKQMVSDPSTCYIGNRIQIEVFADADIFIFENGAVSLKEGFNGDVTVEFSISCKETLASDLEFILSEMDNFKDGYQDMCFEFSDSEKEFYYFM